MPYGSGQVIRQAMMYAKPWQRYVMAGAMIGGGIGLVAVGHIAGVVLATVGGLLLWRMLQVRLEPATKLSVSWKARKQAETVRTPDGSTR